VQRTQAGFTALAEVRNHRGSAIYIENAMASRTYRLFEQAMRRKKQVFCIYNGCPRELCPVILGHSQGDEKALTFQVGGGSRSRLPPGGEWRCLWLAKVRDAELRDGPWRTGSRHGLPQGCVEEVDLDINPDSPYGPRRKVNS
jgi:hypothetical protein